MERTESLPRQTAPIFASSAVQRYCRTAAFAFFLLMIAIGSLPGKAEALSAATHDKFLHFTAYSLLSVLLYTGLGGSLLRRSAGTLALIALLGLLDESIQYFLPYRKPEILDWLFNMLAAALSVTVCGLLQRAIQGRRALFPPDRRIRRKTDRTN